MMTDIQPRHLVTRIILNGGTTFDAKTLPHARAMQKLCINTLQDSLDGMNKEVTQRIGVQRQRAINGNNRAKNIIQPAFHFSDLVVVRRAHEREHKLDFKWCGHPRIVAMYGTLVYGVAKLTTGDGKRVNCVRFRHHRAADENTTAPKGILDMDEMTESRY